MTTAAREFPVLHPRESLSARLVEFVSRAPLHLALVAIGVVWLVPTVGLFVTSFRTRADIFSSGWWTALINWHFTFDNYLRVMASRGTTEALGQNFINSFIITIPSTLLPVSLGALAAYAFAWAAFRGRDWIFLGIVALQIIPLQMTFVPVLQIYNGFDGFVRTLPEPLNEFRMTASFVGLWLAHTAYGLPFAIFLLRGFFASLPRDLIEAAKMDGSSEFNIFLRIILPLSVPALASLTIFQFLWVWNDLLVALIYAQAPQLQPVTTGIKNLLSTYGPEWDLLSAAAFFSMSVPLIVFFSLQRYFVRGLLAGSVKS
ncbi:MAG TPA: carbohydrate ABC transporter permease [Anaerolineae bacterium]